jgi:hypothetical protein
MVNDAFEPPSPASERARHRWIEPLRKDLLGAFAPDAAESPHLNTQLHAPAMCREIGEKAFVAAMDRS